MPPSVRRFNWSLLVVLLTTAALYLPTLSYPFVYDDVPQI